MIQLAWKACTLKQLTLSLLMGGVLLSACSRPGGEDVTAAGRGEARPQPVEMVFTEEGYPDPSMLTEEQVLHRGNGEEPQTLDPHLAEGVPSSHILRDLFEGLTSEGPDGTVVPGAAARWNISRDGKVYTFYLRREAMWSNGDPVTAEDFVYGLRRSANPETASNYAQVLMPIVNAQEVLAGELPVPSLGVEALDEYTLQISLNNPTPYFLGLLNHSSTYPVHRASVEEHGRAFSRPGNLVSNGPFMLVDWVVRSHVLLEKNPFYWDADHVYLQQVYYHGIEDQSTELKQYRAGELDWTYEVPNSLYSWLQEHFSDELVVSTWMGSYFFGYNLVQSPFAENLKLRQALAMVLDRDLLIDKIIQFGEQPSYSLVPPGIGEYQPQAPEWSQWTQEERNEEARRLYREAGYTEENPLQVEIRYNTSENHKKIALAIASLWKQALGVQATLVNEEWKVFLQNREQKVITQVFRAGWISDYNDPYSFLELFRTDNGRNDYGYSNRTFDNLLQQIAEERIPGRRRRLMQEAERLLMEDMPIIPVYTYVTKRLVDPRLQGWQNNSMDHHYSKHMYFVKDQAAVDKERAELEAPEKEVLEQEALDQEVGEQEAIDTEQPDTTEAAADSEGAVTGD